MVSSRKQALAVLAMLLAAAGSIAAESHNHMRWLDVEFPHDAPISLVSFSLGDSTTASVRGTSLALDLHTSLTLRNASGKSIRGLTLSVEAQDLTPSGRASVTVPSLNAAPGEIFPVRVDLELLRPFNTPRNGGALVQVTLDGVLFDDLSFYGPDKLHSRRSLTVYELEARRDRQYFQRLIAQGNTAKLREEMNFGLPEFQSPQLGLELLHDPRSTTGSERPVSVAIVSFPDAPVQMVNGAATIYKNEVRTPHVDLRNRSAKTVQNIEMGWILHDQGGSDFMAGLLPAHIQIRPVQQARVQENGVLRFSHASGSPILVDGVTAFVSNVEFEDGNWWIPSRNDISNSTLDASLKRTLITSPEQQRLAEIYRRRGLTALTTELKKFGK